MGSESHKRAENRQRITMTFPIVEREFLKKDFGAQVTGKRLSMEE
jgi:hypothetical protein